MISGNTVGIKEAILERLDQLFEIQTEKQLFLDEQIVSIMAEVTTLLNREVSVALNRQGRILEIAIGDSHTVKLPAIEKTRGLSGVRIIHTHPNGISRLSDVDISALLSMRLDSMIALGVVDGVAKKVTFGFCAVENNQLCCQMTTEWSLQDAYEFEILSYIQTCDKDVRSISDEIEDENDRAIIVGTDSKESLAELGELAIACEIEVVGSLFQKRPEIDKKYFIGSGKVDEISLERQVRRANMIVFDDELSGVQLRNLEGRLGCRVIDRTMLILEIFAKRAQTREAKMQVLIAKLRYDRSHLTGQGVAMSRLGGGLGAKGSGETKLELDRRKINDLIAYYTKELAQMEVAEKVRKQKRLQSEMPQIALVGYTNVGKSTLRNSITDYYSDDKAIKKEHVLAQNMLFATLSTTTRTFVLPDKRIATLSDTVGFIRKLPHDLVESFKSTLSEVVDADLIVHVVDSSNEEVFAQITAVNHVLSELGCKDKKQILALNKCDVAPLSIREKIKEMSKYPTVEISAMKQQGIDALLQLIGEMLPTTRKHLTILLPYTAADLLSNIYQECTIVQQNNQEDGMFFEIYVAQNKQAKYLPFEVK